MIDSTQHTCVTCGNLFPNQAKKTLHAHYFDSFAYVCNECFPLWTIKDYPQIQHKNQPNETDKADPCT